MVVSLRFGEFMATNTNLAGKRRATRLIKAGNPSDIAECGGEYG
jgi:hypothetical protein